MLFCLLFRSYLPVGNDDRHPWLLEANLDDLETKIVICFQDRLLALKSYSYSSSELCPDSFEGVISGRSTCTLCYCDYWHQEELAAEIDVHESMKSLAMTRRLFLPYLKSLSCYLAHYRQLSCCLAKPDSCKKVMRSRLALEGATRCLLVACIYSDKLCPACSTDSHFVVDLRPPDTLTGYKPSMRRPVERFYLPVPDCSTPNSEEALALENFVSKLALAS